MEEIGIVKSTEGVKARVIVKRKSVCDQCTQVACTITDEGSEIEALNPVKAREGQKVKVSIKPYSYLKGSILIYGIPALSLIAGAILGRVLLPPLLTGLKPDVLSALGGFGALILSLMIIKMITGRMGKKTQFHPVIEEIIDESSVID